MNRRQLLSTVPFLALAACAGQQTATQVAQTAITDAGLVANALVSVLPNLQGVPPDVSSLVATDAQKAIALAQSLNSTMTQASAQPIIQQIQTDATAVAAAVQPYVPPGSPAAMILADVQVLLPVLLLAGGLAAPAAPAIATPGRDVAAARARLAASPK